MYQCHNNIVLNRVKIALNHMFVPSIYLIQGKSESLAQLNEEKSKLLAKLKEAHNNSLPYSDIVDDLKEINYNLRVVNEMPD